MTVYFMACGLLLPVVSLIGRDNVWSIGILCALMIPIPLYIARLRYSIPAQLDRGLERYAYIMLIVGLLSMVTMVMIRVLT